MISAPANRLHKWLPFLAWLPLSAPQVRADLLAGITVALILIPQSMAYAQLAGMPAYYGLYAAFLPVLVGALWGSSRQLATGPVAVVSLLTASALAPLAASGSEQYIALAIMLAMMVGLIQLALGLFRLGTVVNLLSHPVIIGFTNAAAIIIALSQLNKLLGVPMSRSDSFISDIIGVLRQIGDTHLPTLLMGVSALAMMLLLKRYLPKWPNVLIAVALTTLVSWQIGFERDMKLGMEAIQDPAIRALVSKYQDEKVRLDGLQKAIDGHRAALRQARETQLSRARTAALEYQLELAELSLADAEKLSRSSFKTLRAYKFVAVGDAGAGAVRLYTVEAAPPEWRDDRRWRLKRVDTRGLQLDGGGEVIGDIPAGLPGLSMPRLDWAAFTSLLSAALVISLVAFMEAISIAKAMAAKTRSRIDPDQELIGQGLANIVGGVSQSFPTSGSFSRSAVNLNSGAVTGLSSVFTVVIVVLTLLFLTDLLHHLPQAVLAAVIMLAVTGLINMRALHHAWQTHLHDGIAALVTFVATLAFAPHLDMGILFGAGVAITLFLHRRMRPRAEILGRHPDGVLAGMDTHGLPPISEQFVAVRFDGALTFVNVAYFEDMVLEALARFPKARAILLIGSSINEIDVSGEEKIRAIAERLEQIGITFYVSGLKRQVLDVLERAHIHEVIPVEHMFKSKEQALSALAGRYGPPRAAGEAA